MGPGVRWWLAPAACYACGVWFGCQRCSAVGFAGLVLDGLAHQGVVTVVGVVAGWCPDVFGPDVEVGGVALGG